jgi:GNAT superfamily N-acetyltransferase
MDSSASNPNCVRVVDNAPTYWEFIRQLRCDPRVQDAFIERASISPEQQVEYMNRHGGRFVVGLVGDSPAGYAGSIDRDIRVCVHPDFQGLGVGRRLIEALLERFPDSVARIKIQNKASIALFTSCGFNEVMVVMAPARPVSERM